jgi:hypothetical protein
MPGELLDALTRAGVTLTADGESLRYRAPRGALTPELKGALVCRKSDVLRLCQAPPADELSDVRCEVCRSRERWRWIDGRLLCRVCLILDLAPLTLVRQGWPESRIASKEGGR